MTAPHSVIERRKVDRRTAEPFTLGELRLVRDTSFPAPPDYNALPEVLHPQALADFMAPYVDREIVERFWIIAFDSNKRVISGRPIAQHTGTDTSTFSDPRLGLTAALAAGAQAIVIAHNHPNGDITPSRADARVALAFRDACKPLGITMIDAMVLVRGAKYTSLRERGVLDMKDMPLSLTEMMDGADSSEAPNPAADKKKKGKGLPPIGTATLDQFGRDVLRAATEGL